MKTPPLLEPAPFAGREFGAYRCRRYLFDRADGPDPRPPAGDAAAPGRAAPKPPPMGWGDGSEGRR